MRLSYVREALRQVPAGQRTLLVAPSRAAADECAAALAAASGGVFGLTRTSLVELVMRLALPRLARQRVAPTSAIAAEAVVARARFDAVREQALHYFAPVAETPGFPRAAARTLDELQMAGVDPATLRGLDSAGADLAVLLERLHQEASRAGTVTRAGLWQAAIEALDEEPAFEPDTLVVLLDVAAASTLEERFLEALVRSRTFVVQTVPAGDARTLDAVERLSATVVDLDAADVPAGRTRRKAAPPPLPAMRRLQRFLFAPEAPPQAPVDDSVTLFSAPGEGREAVEVVRRVLAEAHRGVPFDEMAILLRAPHTYFGLLEHALARAGVPAWFERGTRRPDPAGRAFLALLACADEQLSARRFAEYLSLGQVPAVARADAAGGHGNAAFEWTPPSDEVSGGFVQDEDRAHDLLPLDEASPADERDHRGVVAGTLRAPWRWEELLVEACVIHGLDRWRRRLRGLAYEYDLRLRALRGEDEDSARVAAVLRDREELAHLEQFALPIVEVLADWRSPRLWREWLEVFENLVPRVIRKPARVLRVLAEMAPLGAIGPVSLAEVRDVLTPRLLTLTHEPPRRREGAVFIGTPASARGRQFRVVFVPGLAERVFPQRLREDALLLDRRRQVVDRSLAVADTRADAERLQLRLAVGAATERIHLSYPRIELGESRPRVPSFYVLDIMRAVTGVIPRYAELADNAAREGGASLAWPAPDDPDRAIDAFEHDLAVLRPLLKDGHKAASNGRARYLIQLNDALRRSVTERWARWQARWHTSDGLIRVADTTRAALEAQRLTARPYSLTALQRFASCPYQFLLSAVYRLAPLEEPAPLQYLDPLTRGSLFHAIQTECLRELQARGLLPVDETCLPGARAVLQGALRRVTSEEYDRLAPAIDRVWHDEVDTMSRDLDRWLEQLVADGRSWVPERFELSFGLPRNGQHDPASTEVPARVDGRFLVRGSIDMVERRPGTDVVRVTDYKTGRNRTTPTTVVDGGRVLQPVLYGLALENITGDTVAEGRLSYCTAAGHYSQHVIPLEALTRRHGVEVLEIIDRAVERGTLAAKPARGACAFCSFVPVCGPDEERRTSKKPAGLLADLDELRRMP